MSLDMEDDDRGASAARGSDLITGAISVAAILMFVGTGSSVLSKTLRH